MECLEELAVPQVVDVDSTVGTPRHDVHAVRGDANTLYLQQNARLPGEVSFIRRFS